MKKTNLIWLVTLLAMMGAWGQQTAIPLTYIYSSNSYDFSKITSRDPGWGQDTMVLRAILDSNGYKGSCIPFITSIVSNSSQINSNPYNVYKINMVQIYNQFWLKKITSNVKQLLYLTDLDLTNDTCLISVDSVNQYLMNLSIINAKISNLNFDPSFLGGLGIIYCKNLKYFPYSLKNIKTIDLYSNGLIDLSNMTLGDNITYNVNLDTNNLITIPINILQTLQRKNIKISVNCNSLGCVTGSTLTLLNEIATNPDWKSTQKPCTQVANKTAMYDKKINTSYINYIFNIQGKKMSKTNYTSSGIYISEFGQINKTMIK